MMIEELFLLVWLPSLLLSLISSLLYLFKELPTALLSVAWNISLITLEWAIQILASIHGLIV